MPRHPTAIVCSRGLGELTSTRRFAVRMRELRTMLALVSVGDVAGRQLDSSVHHMPTIDRVSLEKMESLTLSQFRRASCSLRVGSRFVDA